ncbi:hypothetical protein ACWENR_24245, partial [Micromonospora sp. NPDC004336]
MLAWRTRTGRPESVRACAGRAVRAGPPPTGPSAGVATYPLGTIPAWALGADSLGGQLGLRPGHYLVL